ncbi:MAG: hypothetical protein EZS28_024253, partial [Streblomastix strix]
LQRRPSSAFRHSQLCTLNLSSAHPQKTL